MATYLLVRDSDGTCVNAIVLGDPTDYATPTGMTVYPRADAGEAWIGWQVTDDGWIEPRPFPSWVLDGTHWVAPVAMPDDPGDWEWDEDSQAWIVAE